MVKSRIYEGAVMISVILLVILTALAFLEPNGKSSANEAGKLEYKYDDILSGLETIEKSLDFLLEKSTGSREHEIENTRLLNKISKNLELEQNKGALSGSSPADKTETNHENVLPPAAEEVKETKSATETAMATAASTAENDYLLQQFLLRGERFFNTGDFLSGTREFKAALAICPENAKAILFYNASLFYSNPGDESSFRGIKDALIPLYSSGKLEPPMEKVLLEVLAGIGLEEGDRTSLEKYQNYLTMLEAEN